MSDNERLFLAYDFLKKNNHINTYVELAKVLNTNKMGINDLKTGKKKVSIENIRSMIISYPFISLHWLVTGDGLIEINESKNLSFKDLAESRLQTINSQTETIESLKRENQLLREARETDYDKSSQRSDLGGNKTPTTTMKMEQAHE
jgi:hypothetical protein